MSFNLDPTKQALEGIYSRKSKKPNNPPVKFNKATKLQFQLKNFFGLNLNEKLTVKGSHVN